MQEEIENLEFVHGSNFEFIDWLENNGTKYLLIFDNSCEKICNSKAFVDVATAGRHRGLSTIYIEHNLFHQSKLGRDVEVHNTQIVPLKSLGDWMQVSTLSAQLGLVSEVVVWYPDAVSVTYGQSLIDFRHKQTIDYVIVQTPDPFLQNFISRTGWNRQKVWTMKT